MLDRGGTDHGHMVRIMGDRIIDPTRHPIGLTDRMLIANTERTRIVMGRDTDRMRIGTSVRATITGQVFRLVSISSGFEATLKREEASRDALGASSLRRPRQGISTWVSPRRA